MHEADVTLIAHVGYDVEAIGPFIDALETAASRLCVAVLMERVPASAADPFWPPVHGEARVALPALPDFIELLEARGRRLDLPGSRSSRDGSRRATGWRGSSAASSGSTRRRKKEKRFQAALDKLTVEEAGGWTIRDRGPSEVGIVTWSPTE